MGQVLAYITQLPHLFPEFLRTLCRRHQRPQTHAQPQTQSLMDVGAQQDHAHDVALYAGSKHLKHTAGGEAIASMRNLVKNTVNDEALSGSGVRIAVSKPADPLLQLGLSGPFPPGFSHLAPENEAVPDDVRGGHADADPTPSPAFSFDAQHGAKDEEDEEDSSTLYRDGVPVLLSNLPLTSSITTTSIVPTSTFRSAVDAAEQRPVTTTTTSQLVLVPKVATEWDPRNYSPLRHISAHSNLASNNNTAAGPNRNRGRPSRVQERENHPQHLADRVNERWEEQRRRRELACRKLGARNLLAGGSDGQQALLSNSASGSSKFATSTPTNETTAVTGEREAQSLNLQLLQGNTHGWTNLVIKNEGMKRKTKDKYKTRGEDRPLSKLARTQGGEVEESASDPPLASSNSDVYPNRSTDSDTLPALFQLSRSKQEPKAYIASRRKRVAFSEPSLSPNTGTNAAAREADLEEEVEQENIVFLTGFPLDPLEPDHAKYRDGASTGYTFREKRVRMSKASSRQRKCSSAEEEMHDQIRWETAKYFHFW